MKLSGRIACCAGIVVSSLMNGPPGQTDHTKKLAGVTDPGYSRYRCGRGGRRFDQRTGTPLNPLQFRTAIVFQVVVFRLRGNLRRRHLVRLFLLCGYEFTPATGSDGQERLAPLLAEPLRRQRPAKIASRW